MVRVQPSSTTINHSQPSPTKVIRQHQKSVDLSLDHQTATLTASDQEYEAQSNNNINDKNNPSTTDRNRSLLLRCLLSIRLFLIVVIMFVVLITALSIWVTAYKVNETAALESVNVLIENMNEKISTFVKSKLDVPRRVALNMADDYHNGNIQIDDSVRKYLVSKVNNFNVSLASICMGESGHDVLYAFSRDATHPIPDVYAFKTQNISLLYMAALNSSGDINIAIPMQKYPYKVSLVDYYKESMGSIFKLYPNGGGFGKVYQVIESNLQTYWPSPIYDRSLLKQQGIKKILGMTKVNLSLEGIESFLKQIRVLERGYFIMCEMDDSSFIIGGSVGMPNLRVARVPITNITDRGGGKLMEKLLIAHKETNQSSLQLTIVQDGISYLVSSQPFEFYNIKWRMIVVFEESEIKKGIILSSYVILGVSFLVCIIGIGMSVLAGWIVTKPLFSLEQDFQKIDVLDLINLHKRSSIFTEVNSIYKSLDNTVKWLSEFRAFLPDNVLNTLTNVEQESRKESQLKMTPHHHPSTDRIDQLSSDEMGTSSSSIQVVKQSKSMFGLGLNLKQCCVVTISVEHLSFRSSERMDPIVLGELLSKLLTGISTISKKIRADLQINHFNQYSLVIFDRVNNSSIGVDACLQILTSLKRLNSQMEKNHSDSSPFHISIGVATGPCLQGNIGSKQMRYFSTIGSVVERATDLCKMSSLIGIPVLVDQDSMKYCFGSFVFRPVDRYSVGEEVGSNKDCIETVYQLVRSSRVENDEWLYELEQKKQNSKFDKFNENFELLFNNNESSRPSLSSAQFEDLKVFMMSAGSEDKTIERLGRLLDLVDDSKYLQSYRSNVKTSITSFLLDKEIILR